MHCCMSGDAQKRLLGNPISLLPEEWERNTFSLGNSFNLEFRPMGSGRQDRPDRQDRQDRQDRTLPSENEEFNFAIY